MGSGAETACEQFSYPAASRLPTVLATAWKQTVGMDSKRAAFLDQLTSAIDAGDRQAAAILPMFRHWLIELARDPEAAKHEPGSAGYTARMFALRALDEAAG